MKNFCEKLVFLCAFFCVNAGAQVNNNPFLCDQKGIPGSGDVAQADRSIGTGIAVVQATGLKDSEKIQGSSPAGAGGDSSTTVSKNGEIKVPLAGTTTTSGSGGSRSTAPDRDGIEIIEVDVDPVTGGVTGITVYTAGSSTGQNNGSQIGLFTPVGAPSGGGCSNSKCPTNACGANLICKITPLLAGGQSCQCVQAPCQPDNCFIQGCPKPKKCVRIPGGCQCQAGSAGPLAQINPDWDFGVGGTQNQSILPTTQSSNQSGFVGGLNDTGNRRKWSISNGFPRILLGIDAQSVGEELMIVTADGEYSSYSFLGTAANGHDQYRLNRDYDSFANFVQYSYWPNGNLKETLGESIKNTYERSGLNNEVLLVKTYLKDNTQSDPWIHQVHLDQKLIYDSTNTRLLSVELQGRAGIAPPQSSLGFYDENQVVSDLEIHSLSYDSSNRLVSEDWNRGQYSKTLLSISYDSNGRVFTTTGAHGQVSQFSYLTLANGQNVVVRDDPKSTHRYIFDAAGRISDYRITSKYNPRQANGETPAEPTSLTYHTDYDPQGGGCDNLVSQIIGPDGKVIESNIFEPEFYRLTTESFPSATGVGMDSVSYEYDHPLNGSNLISMIRQDGTLVSSVIEYAPRGAYPDDGFRVQKISTNIPGIEATDGSVLSMNTSLEYMADGRVKREIGADGISHINIYSDEDPSVTGDVGQKDLVKTISGVSDSRGSVSGETLETIFVRTNDEKRRVISVVEMSNTANPKTISYSYDDFDRVIGVRAISRKSVGSEIRLAYDLWGNQAVTAIKNLDAKGQPPKAADGSGNARSEVVSMEVFDGARLLYQLQDTAPLSESLSTNTDPDSWNISQYNYDATSGEVSSITSSGPGAQKTVLIDVDGYGIPYRSYSLGEPAQIKNYYTLTSSKLLELVNDQNGLSYVSSEEQYNQAGLPVLRISPLGDRQRLNYDKLGNLISSVTKNGNVIKSSFRFDYDRLGRIIRKFNTHPAVGVETKLAEVLYSNQGVVKQISGQWGVLASFNYDQLGRVVTEQQGGEEKGYEYQQNTNYLIKSYVKQGNLPKYYKRFEYDDLGRVVKISDTGANDSQSPRSTTVARNSLGQIQRYVFFDGRTSESWYRSDGSVVAFRPVVGQNYLESYSRSFNPTTNELLLSKIDAAGKVDSVVLDASGKAVRSQTSDGLVTSYTYGNGNILSSINRADGATVNFLRDSFGRLTSLDFSKSGQDTISRNIIYNTLGQVAEVSEKQGTAQVLRSKINFTYDFNGRVISESSTPGEQVTYNYKTANNIYDFMRGPRVITAKGSGGSPDVAMIRSFDSLGRIISLSQRVGSGPVTNIANFGLSGNILNTITYAGGSTTETSLYDSYGRLESSVTTSQTNILDGYALSYDSAGRIERIASQEPIGGVAAQFQYDNFDRLIGSKLGVASLGLSYSQASGANEASYTFATDSNHFSSVNSSGVFGNQSQNFTVDTNSQKYASINGQQLGYDPLGLITNDDSRVFNWNILGQLESVLSPNGTSNYQYDALGRLHSMNGKSVVWNGYDRFLTKNLQTGETQAFYNHPQVADELLALSNISSNLQNVYNFSHEYNGTPSKAFLNGVEVESYATDPYGNRLVAVAGGTALSSSSSIGDSIGHHGLDYDDVANLHYNRTRWYDPKNKSFLTIDPVPAPENRGNPYSYLGGNPIGNKDPLGTQIPGMSGQIRGGWPLTVVTQIFEDIADWGEDSAVSIAKATAAAVYAIGAAESGTAGIESLTDNKSDLTNWSNKVLVNAGNGLKAGVSGDVDKITGGDGFVPVTIYEEDFSNNWTAYDVETPGIFTGIFNNLADGSRPGQQITTMFDLFITLEGARSLARSGYRLTRATAAGAKNGIGGITRACTACETSKVVLTPIELPANPTSNPKLIVKNPARLILSWRKQLSERYLKVVGVAPELKLFNLSELNSRAGAAGGGSIEGAYIMDTSGNLHMLEGPPVVTKHSLIAGMTECVENTYVAGEFKASVSNGILRVMFDNQSGTFTKLLSAAEQEIRLGVLYDKVKSSGLLPVGSKVEVTVINFKK